MKFDVIIGNPPYQLSDGSGGSSDAAMPIYNKFISQAKKLNPRFLTMIVPSKWMVGGRGLNKFRDEMLQDNHISDIVDFENASDCFSGIHIDGGVCYFLRKREYEGPVNYKYISKQGDEVVSQRYLKNDYFDYVIRDYRVLSILEKCSSDVCFNNIVSNVKPFGIRKGLFNEPERYPEARLREEEYQGSVKIYGVKGIKGGARRTEGYIANSAITSNRDAIDKYKLFFTTSYSTGAINPPKVIEAIPNEVCTETFLLIGPFESKEEQQNCLSYIETKFFKFLLYFGKGTMQVNKAVFGLIPMQDFKKKWTDEDLYKKYKLTDEEIGFINSIVIIDGEGED